MGIVQNFLEYILDVEPNMACWCAGFGQGRCQKDSAIFSSSLMHGWLVSIPPEIWGGEGVGKQMDWMADHKWNQESREGKMLRKLDEEIGFSDFRPGM